MRIRYKNRFDKQRRDIMKTIASAGISSGLLRSCGLVGGMMIARATEAQSGPNKSLLLLCVGGALNEMWEPSAGMTLGSMSMPYEPVKSEMNFVAKGSMTSGGHGLMFERFTAGSFSEDSFDVNMGKTIGANYPLRYLNLGVQTATSELTKEKSSSGQLRVPVIDDPRSAFSRLSNAVGGGAGGGGTGGGGTSGGVLPGRLYVDAHKEAIAALRTKLGQHEKEKLDSHLSAIEEFEQRIIMQEQEGSGGEPAPAPEVQSCSSISMPAGSDADFDSTAKLQIEMAILALKCNLTASVSLAFGNDGHGFSIPGWDQVFHQSHHCCPGTEPYEITGRYMCSLAARTINRAKEEGILDSTVITQVTDMGDARAHNNTNVPLFVAGGGSAVRRGTVTQASGKTSADLFQTVSNILGASEHPEARTWSSSPISGIAS